MKYLFVLFYPVRDTMLVEKRNLAKMRAYGTRNCDGIPSTNILSLTGLDKINYHKRNNNKKYGRFHK